MATLEDLLSSEEIAELSTGERAIVLAILEVADAVDSIYQKLDSIDSTVERRRRGE